MTSHGTQLPCLLPSSTQPLIPAFNSYTPHHTPHTLLPESISSCSHTTPPHTLPHLHSNVRRKKHLFTQIVDTARCAAAHALAAPAAPRTRAAPAARNLFATPRATHAPLTRLRTSRTACRFTCLSSGLLPGGRGHSWFRLFTGFLNVVLDILPLQAIHRHLG